LFVQGSLTEGDTVDVLVLTSLDQFVFKLEIIFSFLTKQATLMRRPTVLSLPPQLVFPGLSKANLNSLVQRVGSGLTKEAVWACEGQTVQLISRGGSNVEEK
jgi:hypothetical protein